MNAHTGLGQLNTGRVWIQTQAGRTLPATWANPSTLDEPPGILGNLGDTDPPPATQLDIRAQESLSKPAKRTGKEFCS